MGLMLLLKKFMIEGGMMPWLNIRKVNAGEKKQCILCAAWASLENSGKWGRCSNYRVNQLTEEDDVCNFWKSNEKTKGKKWCSFHRQYYDEKAINCPICCREKEERKIADEERKERERPGWK